MLRSSTLTLAAVLAFLAAPVLAEDGKVFPGGQLQILDPGGKSLQTCPLKNTEVTADVAGFIGRTTVKQIFQNPTERKIEAVYVFPLPELAAVDRMVMTVGDRRVMGKILEREAAREVYEAAKAAGHVAGLLDQERPNIFTQSVANIEPGVEVTIEISYVETLKYEDGQFTWSFPMVVGPRYIPGGGSAPAPMTTGTDTPQVPDASKITPPVTPEGTRAGHEISLTLTIDGGSFEQGTYDIRCELHDIETATNEYGQTVVTLKDQAEIPNRDFVLHYRLGGQDMEEGYYTSHTAQGRFFTLILQPPQRVVPAQLMPRELIFVLDTSGSMSGYPIEQAKRVMKMAVEQMREEDEFNIITFAGDTHILWEHARPASESNIAAAQAFLESRSGGGGTEMMKAIDAALRPSTAALEHERMRIVLFMTDGYVGNDMEIIGAVKKYAGTTRVFSFGIGNSINRFLLEGMARAGRGEAEIVTLASNAEAAAERFHERVLAPVLTDIEIDWGTLPVSDVFPRTIPDLFAAKPLIVQGRLASNTGGAITLRGRTGAGEYERTITVTADTDEPDAAGAPTDPLASLWARAKVEHLMEQDYGAAQTGEFPAELRQQVVDLALEFNLMTQFTSFVAVEEMTVTVGGAPVRVDVPVEMPQGVSYEGVYGQEGLVPAYAGVQLFQSSSGKSQSRGAVMRRMSSGAAAPAPAPIAGMGAPAAGRPVRLAEELADEDEDGFEPAPPPEPAQKLAESLRDLAAKVEKEGKDGVLTVGKLQVTNHRVDIMIYLDNLSDETRKALADLGFEQQAESRTANLLIGSLDVRKLEDLAKLESVLRVRPVVEP